MYKRQLHLCGGLAAEHVELELHFEVLGINLLHKAHKAFQRTGGDLHGIADSKIDAGPLEGFMGLVEAIDTENFKVKLKVNMFGRETPAEVEIGQVELP